MLSGHAAVTQLPPLFVRWAYVGHRWSFYFKMH